MKKRSAAGSRPTIGRMSLKRRLFDSSAAVTSIGLVVVAKPGSTSFSAATVSGWKRPSGRSSSVARSAAMTQLAPELLMATRRRPSGRQPLR